jgi:hypothetical protein
MQHMSTHVQPQFTMQTQLNYASAAVGMYVHITPLSSALHSGIHCTAT